MSNLWDYFERNADKPDDWNTEELTGADVRMLLAMRAQRDALLAALKECADDLEASIEAEYKGTLDYPSQQRRYERDMEPVRNARAALKLAKGEGAPTITVTRAGR